MTTYLAWKGGNGCFGRWHLRDTQAPVAGDRWTLCGKIAPADAQVSMEHRNDAEDTCKTCKERKKRERE